MSTIDLKSNLHQLIDGIQNTKLLESLHDLLSERKNAKAGTLWNSLSESQKQEVMDAYEESEKPENLTSHTEILRKYK
ncbi:hypothetical protein [Ekhidna sp.]|uniref:hypothetical protein n=1 Tax=Ekhidna sp. TaxID=2608089 RepID=UPI003CCB80A5